MPTVDDGYGTFYAASFERVARAIRSSVGPDADDVAQEALLVARARWSDLQTFDDPLAWVIRVAVRMAMRRARRDRERIRLEANANPKATAPPPDLDLVAAILGLPDRHAAAIRLHHLEDRPVAELAERLGCSEGAAKVVLYRARRVLAERLVGVTGHWVSQASWTPRQIERYLVGVGWSSHLGAVLDDDFGGRGGRFQLSVRDGFYELRRDDGRRFDHGASRIDGRAFELAPTLATGRGRYTMTVEGTRLTLGLVEATSPPTRGVPDEIWANLFIGSASFRRSEPDRAAV